MKYIVEGSDINFDQEVLNSDVPVLVNFCAPWCGSCSSVEPIVDTIAMEYQGQLKVVKLNTDDNQEVAARFGIRSIPTFGIFINGKAVDCFIGVVQKKMIGKRIKPYIHEIN
jgi:thioredoxin 1